MILNLIVSAITFACATYLALELAGWLVKREGAAQTAAPEIMQLLRILMPIASGIVGAMLASYFVDYLTFTIVGIVCAALGMATWSEIGYGRVPEVILIVPLVVLLAAATFAHKWGLVGASVFLAAPFVVLGLLSRGKGVARADTELAAIGGAILGLQVGLAAFGIAILVAFIINMRNRGTAAQIALTPYLSGCIVVGVVVRLALPTIAK